MSDEIPAPPPLTPPPSEPPPPMPPGMPPPAATPRLPWEERQQRGFFPALIETVKMVVTPDLLTYPS